MPQTGPPLESRLCFTAPSRAAALDILQDNPAFAQDVTQPIGLVKITRLFRLAALLDKRRNFRLTEDLSLWLPAKPLVSWLTKQSEELGSSPQC